MTLAKKIVYNACKNFAPASEVPKIAKTLGFTAYYIKKKKIRETVDISKTTIITYKDVIQKNQEAKIGKMQRQSILDFCHAEEASSIDSNASKPVKVTTEDRNVEKHAARVFVAKTTKEMYDIFRESHTVEQYKKTYPEYSIPCISSFHKYRCPCCSAPTMQSCVDIYVSKLWNYQQALSKFIQNNRVIQDELASCKCEQCTKADKKYITYLNRRVEDIVEATCCPKTLLTQGYNMHGIGSTAKRLQSSFLGSVQEEIATNVALEKRS